MGKKPEIILRDGGVVADFICSCGHKIRVSIWGMVYTYDKKGIIVNAREHCNNVKKCKCGRKYIFITIPYLAYKELKSNKDKKV